MTPAEIEAIKDPAERAKEAAGFMARAKVASDEVEQIRNHAIVELHDTGWSQRKIAKELKLSPARIAQLTNGQVLDSGA